MRAKIVVKRQRQRQRDVVDEPAFDPDDDEEEQREQTPRKADSDARGDCQHVRDAE